MEMIILGNVDELAYDPCCGGAYDYDNDNNCVQDCQ